MISYMVAFLAFIAACLALRRALSDHRVLGDRIHYLEQKLVEAENKATARAKLANEVAHEIKNPITAILCSVETLDLLIGKDLDPLHRDSLGYIRDYGDDILRLLSDFLDVSMAEQGVLKAVPESFLIGEAVDGVFALLQSAAIKKQITLHKSGDFERLYTFADKKHVKQIVFNLVHNAVRYTQEGGEVRISIDSNFPSPYLKVAVTDNGPGIAPEDADSVFDVYKRLETKSPEQGLGLGLGLTKELVTLNGGAIDLASRPGKGTRFEVLLPLDQGASEAEPVSLSEDEDPALPFDGQRFLVVDGDEGARKTIASLLEALGAVVDATSETIEAVEAIKQWDYHTVLLDADVDNGEVLKLAEQLKSLDQGGEMKLVLTDRGAKRTTKDIPKSVDHYISKPLNGKAIIRTLLH